MWRAFVSIHLRDNLAFFWQDDILGAGVTPVDEDCYVSMDLAEKGRYWDILAFLDGGSYSTYSHINEKI